MVHPSNNQANNMQGVNPMSSVNQMNQTSLQNNMQPMQPVNNVVTSNNNEPFDVSSMFGNNL